MGARGVRNLFRVISCGNLVTMLLSLLPWPVGLAGENNGGQSRMA